jgi:RIO-like serine/threonine protein kinase
VEFRWLTCPHSLNLLRFAKQVLSTVFEARAVGLVHEDIKPDNIITVHGDAYLIDWETGGSLFFFFSSLLFLVPFLSSL